MPSLYTQLGESLGSRFFPLAEHNREDAKEKFPSVCLCVCVRPSPHPTVKVWPSLVKLNNQDAENPAYEGLELYAVTIFAGKPLKAGETRPGYCHLCSVKIPAGLECQGLPGFGGI
jgi:hypothetical protein